MKLSAAQRHVLSLIESGKGPYWGCRYRNDFVGRTNTISSLLRGGFMAHNKLTHKGRAALAADS